MNPISNQFTDHKCKVNNIIVNFHQSSSTQLNNDNLEYIGFGTFHSLREKGIEKSIEGLGSAHFYKLKSSNICSEQQKIFVHFNKILSCINSCVLEEQLESCRNSVKNFQVEFYSHVAVGCFIDELQHQIFLKLNSLPN